jgi:hypothetical protein
MHVQNPHKNYAFYQKVLNFTAAMVRIEFSNPILLKNMQDLEFT